MLHSIGIDFGTVRSEVDCFVGFDPPKIIDVLNDPTQHDLGLLNVTVKI